jgi:hypothetical protein
MNEPIVTINNREYVINCQLINGTPGNTDPIFSIPYNYIEEIEIVDNMFSSFISVTMKISTPRNLIEKIPFKNAFRFNANSRNLISISISPTDNPIETFVYVGVIDKSYVISSSDSSSSITVLSIIDTKEAALKEIKAARFYPRIDSSISVSENIKNILKFAHPEENVEQLFHPENFVLNGQEGLKLPDYQFPFYYNLYDAIKFLVKYNISQVEGLNSQFFVRWNTDFMQYDNFSVFNLFLGANKEEYNLEGFTLGNQETDNSLLPQQVLQGGTGSSNNNTNNIIPSGKVFVPPFNIINNLTYSNINFDISNRDLLSIYCWQTNQSENFTDGRLVKIEDVLQKFGDTILNCQAMKDIYGGSSYKIVPNIDIDGGKDSNQNYKVLTTPFTNDVNVVLAESQLYNSFLFQNMLISFEVLGALYRSPGHFIVMTKSGDYGGPFDEKILGHWLVTEVKHTFSRGIYKNNIQCVKPFRVE